MKKCLFLSALIFSFLSAEENFPLEKMDDILKKDSCSNCKEAPEEIDTHLYVFMSFAVPDNAWMSLSEELEKEKGVFVLRGLPGNNFTILAQKTAKLKEKGVSVPIQIHPDLFEKYNIKQVPTFVLKKGASFDKVAGNISLKAALEILD